MTNNPIYKIKVFAKFGDTGTIERFFSFWHDATAWIDYQVEESEVLLTEVKMKMVIE